MSPFSHRTHPLAELVIELRTSRRIPDAWRQRYGESIAALWRECAEPGVLLDVLFLAADKGTWMAAMRAVLEEALHTPSADAVEALRAVCDAVRVIAPSPPSLESLVQKARARSASELDAMGYALEG